MAEISENNKVDIITLDKLTNQQRIDAVVPYLINCTPRYQIIDKFSKEWHCCRKTVSAVIQEALIWLSDNSISESEQVKTLNAERLDGLLGDCKNVKEKLRVIDMLNRLYGLYDTNVVVSNKENDTIKFDLGLDNDNKE